MKQILIHKATTTSGINNKPNDSELPKLSKLVKSVSLPTPVVPIVLNFEVNGEGGCEEKRKKKRRHKKRAKKRRKNPQLPTKQKLENSDE